jgi:protein-L-isoaspartate(D-aspartate) O-methyltransferase
LFTESSENFVHARKDMVRRQIIGRGVKDVRVLAAMEEVPRHVFVDPDCLDSAYGDHPLGIGHGQTISQPYMVAVMTELLALTGAERVLEVGTGSGYQAAILSRLCGWVYTIERIEALSRMSRQIFAELGYTNVTFFVGDGTMGLKSHAPFDCILVTAGAPAVPSQLVDQLVVGGRLVIPVGNRFSQTLKKIIRTKSDPIVERHTECRFVDLVGENGW